MSVRRPGPPGAQTPSAAPCPRAKVMREPLDRPKAPRWGDAVCLSARPSALQAAATTCSSFFWSILQFAMFKRKQSFFFSPSWNHFWAACILAFVYEGSAVSLPRERKGKALCFISSLTFCRQGLFVHAQKCKPWCTWESKGSQETEPRLKILKRTHHSFETRNICLNWNAPNAASNERSGASAGFAEDLASETQGLLNFSARLCSQHTSQALLGYVFHLPKASEPVLRKILHPSEFSLPSHA